GLVPLEVGENTRHGKGLTRLRHKVTGTVPPEGAGRGIPGQPSPCDVCCKGNERRTLPEYCVGYEVAGVIAGQYTVVGMATIMACVVETRCRDKRGHLRRNIRLCITPCLTATCIAMKKRANITYLI